MYIRLDYRLAMHFFYDPIFFFSHLYGHTQLPILRVSLNNAIRFYILEIYMCVRIQAIINDY